MNINDNVDKIKVAVLLGLILVAVITTYVMILSSPKVKTRPLNKYDKVVQSQPYFWN